MNALPHNMGTSRGSDEDEPDVTLGRRVAYGAAWMVLARIIVRLVGVASTFTLVRLLAPDDFGIVAMAGVTAGLLDMLSGFSFDLALVQAKTTERSQFDTVWTLNVLRGILICAGTVTSAPVMAAIMDEPRIENVMYVLALVPFLRGVENVALIKWQRDLCFDKLFWLNAYGKIAGFFFVIPAALILRNYWALTIAQVGTSVITVPLGYCLLPYRPKLTLSAWRPLFHFSKWLAANNVLAVMETYSLIFLISRLFGPGMLGLYQVAAEIGHLPASEVAAPIRQPMYAGYARVADNLSALRQQFVGGFGLILMLFVPLSVGLAVTADSITSLCLGPKWVGAAPLITISALWALFDNLTYFAISVYIIKGAQARYAFNRAAVQLARIPLVIIFGLAYGVVGALLAITFTSIIGCFVLFHGLLPLLRMRWIELTRVAWRTIAAASGMAAGVCLLATIWPTPNMFLPLTMQLGALCLTGALIYVGLQMCLWLSCGREEGPERHVIQWVRSISGSTTLRRPAFD